MTGSAGHGRRVRRLGSVSATVRENPAVATPQASFGGEFVHEDLFAMAAAYAFHIAQNQPCLDGNKRTGLMAALVFLELNRVSVRDPAGRLHDAMIALAERRLDKPGLAALLRELGSGRPA